MSDFRPADSSVFRNAPGIGIAPGSRWNTSMPTAAPSPLPARVQMGEDTPSFNPAPFPSEGATFESRDERRVRDYQTLMDLASTQNQRDPKKLEETKAKIQMSMYLADQAQVPAGDVYASWGADGFSPIAAQYFKDINPPMRYREKIANSWVRAGKQYEMIQMGANLLGMKPSDPKWDLSIAQYRKLADSLPAPDEFDEGVWGWMQQIPTDTIQNAPYFAEMLAAGGVVGGVGALLGGALAGPPGATAGLSIGRLAGAGLSSYNSNAGSTYMDILMLKDESTGKYLYQLLDKEQLAGAGKIAATVAGAVEAAFDVVGFEALIGKGVLGRLSTSAMAKAGKAKLIQATMARFLKLYGVGVLTEGWTEAAQDIVGQIAQNIVADAQNDKMHTMYPKADWAQFTKIASDSFNAAVRGSLAFGILGAGGQLSEASGEVAAARAEGKAAERAVTTKQRVAALPPVVQKTVTELERQKEAVFAGIKSGEIPYEVGARQALDLAHQIDMAEQAATPTTPQRWQLTKEEDAAQTAPPADEAAVVERIASDWTPDVREFREKLATAFPAMGPVEVDATVLVHGWRAEAMGLDMSTYIKQEFDPLIAKLSADQRVSLGEGKRGGVVFAREGVEQRIGEITRDAQALILTTQQSDFVTAMHESFHIFRKQLGGDLLGQAERYYGVQQGTWTRGQEEQWAEDGLRYLTEGVSPRPELEPVFKMIARWVVQLYNKILGRELSAEKRAVFEQLFAKPGSGLAQAAAQEVLSPEMQRQAEIAAARMGLDPAVLFQEHPGWTRSLAELRSIARNRQAEAGARQLRTQAADEAAQMRQRISSAIVPVQQHNVLAQPSPEGHLDVVRQAVLDQEPVPQKVLEQYADDPVVRAELDAREVAAEDARALDEEDEYIDYAMSMPDGPSRGEMFWRNLWQQAHRTDSPASAEKFLNTLSKKRLEAILMGDFEGRDDLTPTMQEAIAAVREGNHTLTDEQYQNLRAEIQGDPAGYRSMFTEANTADPETVVEGELDHDADTAEELKRLKATKEYEMLGEMAKWGPSKIGKLKDTIVATKEKLMKAQEALASEKGDKVAAQKRVGEVRAELMAMYKIRDMRTKLVKRIMRKPSKATYIDQASQIMDIQRNIELRGGARAQEALRQLQELAPSAVKGKVRKHIGEFTFSELQDLDIQITALRKAGKEIYDAKVRAFRETVQYHIRSVVGEVLPGGVPRRIQGVGKSKLHPVAFVNFNSQNALRWSETLGKTSHQLLYRDVAAAKDRFWIEQNRRMETFNTEFRKLGISNAEIAARYTVQPVGDQVMTFDNATLVWIASQNEQYLQHILGEYSQEEVDAIVAALPAKFKEYGKLLMKVADEYERLAEVAAKMENRPLQKVDNYFPIISQTFEQVNQEMSADILAHEGARTAYPSRGFTKARVRRSATPVRKDATAIALSAVDKQEHYISHAELVKTLHRVYDSKEVRAAITERYGENATGVVQEYVNRIGNPESYKVHDGLSSLANLVRSNIQVAALAFNMLSVFKNVTGVMLYGAYAPAHIIGAMFNQATNPREFREFVESRSPRVKNRQYDPFVNDLRRLSGSKYQAAVKKMGEVGLTPFQIIDRWSVMVGWRAVYDKTIGQGLSENEAIQAADDATSRSQPSGAEKDMPQMYKNDLFRMFLLFTSPLNQIWGMMTHDLARDVRGGHYATAVQTVASLALTGLAISMMSKKKVPEEPEEWITGLLAQFLDAMPLVGPTIQAGISGGYASRGTAIVDVTEIVALMNSIKKGQDAERVGWAAIRAAGGAARIAGLPAVALQRMARTFLSKDFEPQVDLWQMIGGGPKEK